jgi:GT2 family glycosyltransferase
VARRRVAILVLAHNKPEYVGACLRSILARAEFDLELVLVDNGSAADVAAVFDSVEAAAVAAGHTIKRLRFDENVGAIRGRNEGMALVESTCVAWVDSDCLVRSRGWLSRLVAHLDGSSDTGIVGPKLVYPWPPHRIQCAGCEVTRSGRVVFRGRGETIDDARFNEARDCPTLISACWLMRTEFWHQLGPLDERFSPVQFEDVDYCYRARAAGRRVVYCPDVEMYHFEGMTTVRTPGIDYNSLTARNAVKFKRKWREAIEREGGVDDRDVRWNADVGWRPINEVGEPPTVA